MSSDVNVIEGGGLTIRTQRQGNTTTIATHGELDVASRDLLDRELQRVGASDVAEVLLDLRGLDFVDSTGFLVIYQAYIRLGERLKMRRGNEQVERSFARSGVWVQFPFID